MVTYQLLLGALGLLCGIGVAAGVFALVASLGMEIGRASCRERV